MASESILALLMILCYQNTYYVQYTILSSVEEMKMIKTQLLLSRGLSIWRDR